MRGAWKLALGLALVVLLAAGFAACGGDSGSTTTAPAGADGEETTAAGTDAETESGPSAAFLTRGGDNSVQTFGEEADEAEVDAATATLAGYLRAWAGDDWAGACRHLAEVTVEPLEELAPGSARPEGEGCPAVLATLTAGTARSTRTNTLTDGIASLRVEGDRAFALYHGQHGVDYFVPMDRENGEWKVASLEPTPFP